MPSEFNCYAAAMLVTLKACVYSHIVRRASTIGRTR